MEKKTSKKNTHTITEFNRMEIHNASTIFVH